MVLSNWLFLLTTLLYLSLSVNGLRYILYDRHHPNLPVENIDQYQTCADNSTTMLIVHGFRPGDTTNLVQLKDEIFKYLSHVQRVVIVDWCQHSNVCPLKYRDIADNKVPWLSDQISNFMVQLWKKKFKKFDLIGHSLGAHASGHAARKFQNLTGIQAENIIGLDPAGPNFDRYIDIKFEVSISFPFSWIYTGFQFIENAFVEVRRFEPLATTLSKNDAKNVFVIHTDTKYYGIEHELGHFDIFPNGGYNQPGCNFVTNIVSSCSHSYAWKYLSYIIQDMSIYQYLHKNQHNSIQSKIDQFFQRATVEIRNSDKKIQLLYQNAVFAEFGYLHLDFASLGQFKDVISLHSLLTNRYLPSVYIGSTTTRSQRYFACFGLCFSKTSRGFWRWELCNENYHKNYISYLDPVFDSELWSFYRGSQTDFSLADIEFEPSIEINSVWLDWTQYQDELLAVDFFKPDSYPTINLYRRHVGDSSGVKVGTINIVSGNYDNKNYIFYKGNTQTVIQTPKIKLCAEKLMIYDENTDKNFVFDKSQLLFNNSFVAVLNNFNN